jgi:hypothetical protein
MLYGEVPHGLCTNPQVNDGIGCDSIVCPPGTYSDLGYAIDGKPCKKCPEGTSSVYLGSLDCHEITEAIILSMLYDILEGDSWEVEHRMHWSSNKNVCEWGGVACGAGGEITSLTIPLTASPDF